MSRRVVPLLVAFACTPTTPVDEDTDDTDAGEESDDTDVTADTALDETDEPPPGITFTEGRWQVLTLRILQPGRGLDLDGDGDVDNQIATLLNAVDAVFGAQFNGMSVDDVNARIDDMLLDETVIVLLDGRYDGVTMTIDVVQGQRDPISGDLSARPDSYLPDGTAVETLDGRFTDVDSFELGPAPLALPIQLYPNEPVLRIASPEARFIADLTGPPSSEGLDGNIAGVFTVAALEEGLIRPMLEAYYTGDEVERMLGLVLEVVMLQADLEVDGEPALGGAFGFDALPEPWLGP